MHVDMAQFHQTFFEESSEGLEAMESGLLGLKPGAADLDVINAIFRAAHSIKGGAATFGFTAVSSFTHLLETLLDQMRSGVRPVAAEAVATLLDSVDGLRELLTAARAGQSADAARIAGLQNRLEALLGGTGPAPAGDDAKAAASGTGWHIGFRPHAHFFHTGNDPARLFRELATLGELEVRADVSKLPALNELDPTQCYLAWELTLRTTAPRAQIDEVFAWVEDDCDLQIAPLEGPAEHVPNAATAAEAANAPAKPASEMAGSIRVGIDKIDALINMVGELVITQSMLSQLGTVYDDMDARRFERLLDGLKQLERNTRELQESVMRIRMVPISFAFSRFPRMVHDVSARLGKRVELRMSGEQTELDKTVMEKIGDPLVHLVRNALDHGIEAPDVRLAAGKPETGTLWLNAYHQGGNIVIEISEDGAGINREKVLAKARKQGLIGADQALSDEQINDLIFEPGFSTAETVSDVSGRGVGMDVVRRNIKALGGRVEVQSRLGEGTTFSIRLPLTLAILDGQLVRVGEQIYIVPLVSIVESIQLQPQLVGTLAQRAEVYRLREEYVPVVRMHEIFEMNVARAPLGSGLLVVAEGDGRKVGLFVDDLLGQQQVVIKSLETNFRKVDGVSGATILGDGTVALILDIAGLIEVSQRKSPVTGRGAHMQAVA